MADQIEVMNELIDESIEALKELFDEEVKPIIEYRVKLEKSIADKEIENLYKMEQEVP